MTWVRVDDSFYDHAKFTQAGPLGIAQWVTGLAWSNRNQKDGFIPTMIARRLLDWDGVAWQMWMGETFGGGEDADGIDVSNHLVACGLWESVEGGYQVHDYHDYQPSSEEIQAKRLALSKQRAEAGRRGGQTTQGQRPRLSEANEQTVKQNGSNPQATPKQTVEQRSSPNPNPNPLDNYFAQFWDVVPRKVGRRKAASAFASATKRTDPTEIIEGMRRLAADPNLPTERQFIPHPTTWLNRDGWDDDPLPPRLNGNGKRPEPANVRMGANGVPERFSPGSGWIQDSAVS